MHKKLSKQTNGEEQNRKNCLITCFFFTERI